MIEEEKKEIENKILELKKRLFSLRMKKSTGELANTSEIKKIKKEIARLFTKLNTEA